MKTQNYTCIVCPLSCQITLSIDNDEIIQVTGNTCRRGEEFARNEYKNPVRTLTTVVGLENSEYHCLPVISDGSISKDKLMECLEFLKNIKVSAPVSGGDVIVEDILSTGVNIIAAKTIK